MDVMNTDLTDNQQLDELSKKISEADRQTLIEALQQDLATPLPDDLESKAKVVMGRTNTIDQVRKLNHSLNTETPKLEEAPKREDIDKYQMEFLIDNWMPADRLTILTGPGGTGKSYLALQHIAGLAMGVTDYFLKPYHGTIDELYSENPHTFRKDPIKVVIASYEEDLSETWKRIATICDQLGWADYDKLTKQIRFVDLKMFGPIWGVEQDTHLANRAKLLEIGDWLLSQCDAFDARLLMLDPSAGAFGGSEIARESVREFCSYLNGWGQQVNCATLLIAHPPKSGDDYSGSTDWLGSCRAMWTLRAEERTTGTSKDKEIHHWYQLTNVKQNYAAPQRAVYLKKIYHKTEKRWTPIWKICAQEDAKVFYNDYHSPKPPEDTDNDNPYANVFEQ